MQIEHKRKVPIASKIVLGDPYIDIKYLKYVHYCFSFKFFSFSCIWFLSLLIFAIQHFEGRLWVNFKYQIPKVCCKYTLNDNCNYCNKKQIIDNIIMYIYKKKSVCACECYAMCTLALFLITVLYAIQCK